jgi:hypothetical protein
MEMSKVLEGAEDEPAGIVTRSADGRLFFIPETETERLEIGDSNLYKAFLAAGGGASSAQTASLYPCALSKSWLDSHSPKSAKWRRYCLEYFDNCV